MPNAERKQDQDPAEKDYRIIDDEGKTQYDFFAEYGDKTLAVIEKDWDTIIKDMFQMFDIAVNVYDYPKWLKGRVDYLFEKVSDEIGTKNLLQNSKHSARLTEFKNEIYLLVEAELANKILPEDIRKKERSSY